MPNHCFGPVYSKLGIRSNHQVYIFLQFFYDYKDLIKNRTLHANEHDNIGLK